MLSDGELINFVPVTDIGRAMHFYGDVLGLTVSSCEEQWCVIDSNGTTLRLTLVQTKPDTDYTVVGWAVVDVQATASELASRGVAFQRYEGFEQNEVGIWTAPSGDQVAWFQDPDGNILSVTQFGATA